MPGSDRRHGPGQSHANSTFQAFVLKMIGTHKDNARQGIKHFESVPARKKVSSDVLWHHIDSTQLDGCMSVALVLLSITQPFL